MKYENISFSQQFIDKVRAGMGPEEFEANVGHHFLPCCPQKIDELYKIIMHGHNQEPATVMGIPGHEQSSAGDAGTDATELH